MAERMSSTVMDQLFLNARTQNKWLSKDVTDAQLRENAARLAEVCKRETLRFSPRLQVWLWGAKRGV